MTVTLREGKNIKSKKIVVGRDKGYEDPQGGDTSMNKDLNGTTSLEPILLNDRG